MTISYNLDVSSTSWKSFLRLLLRWRGSVWKAVFSQLIVWTCVYLLISLIYRFVLTESHQKIFESLVTYFNTGIDSHIPLTFMLGFFVSFVVGRWGSILNGIGWIDNSAVCFATFIRGSDTETRILRRTLVRYMVLTQALVLRDISMQVRKRFPTLDTLEAAGLITKAEVDELDAIYDPYSRYWSPIQWCYGLLYEARLHGNITSDHLLQKITDEIQVFRHGLSSLLKYDWVPIPLLYPQIILFSVRLYFLICLIGRQFIVRPGALHRSEIDLWIPIVTMIQFTVYVGWMKVAEALLNPLGEDDDDLECNYVIDKNLITGLTLVDQGGKKCPDPEKDFFWNDDHVAPLYSLESAKRTVHPLIGSASGVNLVKNIKTVTMIPHKSKLSKMDEETQQAHVRIVNVEEHNMRHRSQRKMDKVINPNDSLIKVRKRNKNAGGGTYNGLAMASRSVPMHLEGAAKPHQVHAVNSVPKDISWPMPGNDSNFDHHPIDGPNHFARDSGPPTSGSWAKSTENPQKSNSEKKYPPSSPRQYLPYMQHSPQEHDRHPSTDNSRGLRRF